MSIMTAREFFHFCEMMWVKNRGFKRPYEGHRKKINNANVEEMDIGPYTLIRSIPTFAVNYILVISEEKEISVKEHGGTGMRYTGPERPTVEEIMKLRLYA